MCWGTVRLACGRQESGAAASSSGCLITDYFSPSQFTEEYPAFLKQYNPTSIYRPPSCPKRPVGRSSSKHVSKDKGVKDQGVGRKDLEKKKTGICRSYSYAQKLKVVQYARLNTEAEASK